jgi:BioD-like phosphotransacetylase family protein
MPTPLVIGSCEPFSGKSSVVLGLARRIAAEGHSLIIGKPLATCLDGFVDLPPGAPLIDADVRFMGRTLGLAEDQLIPSLHVVDPGTAQRRLVDGELEPGEGFAALRARLATEEDRVVLLEAPGSLSEGILFGLDLPRLARDLDAAVVLVHPWRDATGADALLEARLQLGDRLAGVVLNAIDPATLPQLRAETVPALERLGLPVIGLIPRSPLLRSVSVQDLARRLEAEVLCCRERLDLMVETLTIGAMNVNAAMEFFRKRRNMAVVTGADRTDIQLAALEASTQCLILTGVGEPLPQLLSRAEELEVPVLKVDHDTLTTVERVESVLGHGRLHESVKATHAIKHVIDHCSFERLFDRLQLPLQV